jgi:hypothetical protein
MIKFKTIWHYAIAFFETKYALKKLQYQIPFEIIYGGEIKNLTREKASEIAQIHPNCFNYYEDAMMPLFQVKRKTLSGTEDPVLALESYKTKKENDFPYILIWEIF